jgi:hypothetical protein
MKAQLLIRASMSDHLVVADLLAPAAGLQLHGNRPLIAQLVADAHVAEARPSLSQAAQAAGIPYLVDPTTPLLQSTVAPDDRWAKLPFAVAAAQRPDNIDVDRLAAEVVDFEVGHGATVVIPPYLYASVPTDPWSRLNLALIAATRQYLDRENIRLPMMPVLCLQLQSFGHPANWSSGIDRQLSVASEYGSASLALCLSPAGAGSDHYAKVLRLFQLVERATSRDLPVYAWRQGVYGLGLTAAGLAGYETGIGNGEQTNVARQQAARKPKNDDSPRSGGGGGVYIETIGRSVPRRAAQALLGNIAMRPKVMCDVETCCPTVAATLDRSRHHAVRSRARALGDLADQPHQAWRLNHVARHAAAAVTLVDQANKAMARDGVNERINSANLLAIKDVCTFLVQDKRKRSA